MKKAENAGTIMVKTNRRKADSTQKRKISKVVVIFLLKHFENRDFHRYGYFELKRQGYEYEAWSIADWMYDKRIEYPKRMAVNDCVLNIGSKGEFDAALDRQDMRHTFFIVYPSGEMSEVARYIKKRIKRKKGRFGEYSYPMSLMHEYDGELVRCRNFFDVSLYYLKKVCRGKEIRKRALSELLFALRYPGTLNFMQCEVAYASLPNKFDVYKRKTVLLPTMDHDEYLKCQKNKKLKCTHQKNISTVGRYGLYIDGYLMGSTDFKKAKVKMPISKKEVFCRELDRFFACLEKQYDCEIVIALHPKAEYETDPFGGRKIIEGDTALLIRDSLFCIFDYSTSFDWILLYHKNFFQIANDELLRDASVNPIMKKYKDFGNCVINISDSSELEHLEEKINYYEEKKYAEYVRRYIKPADNIDKTSMYMIGKAIGKIR